MTSQAVWGIAAVALKLDPVAKHNCIVNVLDDCEQNVNRAP